MSRQGLVPNLQQEFQQKLSWPRGCAAPVEAQLQLKSFRWLSAEGTSPEVCKSGSLRDLGRAAGAEGLYLGRDTGHTDRAKA